MSRVFKDSEKITVQAECRYDKNGKRWASDSLQRVAMECSAQIHPSGTYY